MIHRYSALGLDIVAPFPCQGFSKTDGPLTGREIALQIGPVPAQLADPVCVRPLLQIDAADTALFHVPGVARYLIRDRNSVTIALEPGAERDRAVDFLKGTPLALVCMQWQLVPLNAVAMALDGHALLLAGSPGIGKSTLAAALADKGLGLLADGLCALEQRPGSPPMIWPGSPEIRLWPDSIAALGHPLPEMEPSPGGRYCLSGARWFQPMPCPIGAIGILRRTTDGLAAQARRHRGSDAFKAVIHLARQPQTARALALDRIWMPVAAQIARDTPLYELWYPHDLSKLSALPDWVLERMELAAGPAQPTTQVAPAGSA